MVGLYYQTALYYHSALLITMRQWWNYMEETGNSIMWQQNVSITLHKWVLQEENMQPKITNNNEKCTAIIKIWNKY